MRIKSSVLKSSILFIFFLLTLLMQLIFKCNALLTEKFYSTGLYPYIAKVLSSASVRVPFSLGDAFYVSLILLLLAGLVLLALRKIGFGRFLIRVLQTIALVYVLFYWLWGFNYYRQSAHQRLHLNKSPTNDSIFIRNFIYVIEQTNYYYSPQTQFKPAITDALIEASYKSKSAYLGYEYPMGRNRTKRITFSDFFAKATILGYYGPFFNETHVNKHLTAWDIPVVTAHEKSHRLGITSEAEAGFYGWLICVNSKDDFISYAGWLYVLDYFIYQSRGIKNRKELIAKIRPEVLGDMSVRNAHWRSWRNEKIDDVTTKVNDAYLKSNNIQKGIDDYNDVVQLIIDFLEGEQSAESG
ncbi:Protein of unknown function [Saccharicrinis carchari]|uniref:DUF3810 domain-containing protein n=1 Tax=Saccharicrinis carchari TaxID=1168039 RepID=A0A521CNW0_SACCC|nr:DUF3810 domain-containing protein [Saccharicrinis carchari]SMO61078.1 Protein of unknown function [Saccharicrinis carchari]